MIYISLLFGVLIGALNIIPKRYLKYNDLFTLFGVITLLFIMGISLGIKVNLKDLRTLGYQSIVFTIMTVFFSILVVFIFAKFVLKEKKS